MPQYKHGKITEPLTFQQIQNKVEQATKKLNREKLSYFWLLYYAGCRKSELYERNAEKDCSLKDGNFIIDFGKRKKNGSQVPPLKFPIWFPGMGLVVKHFLAMKKAKKRFKLLERTENKQRVTHRVKALWLFPNVHKTTALKIVKTVLGPNYYPHFLRLNRITEMCSDSEVSLTRLKSFTGIRSVSTLQDYMGVAEKEQDATIAFMAKQIQKTP